jgi:hypothetical protein
MFRKEGKMSEELMSIGNALSITRIPIVTYTLDPKWESVYIIPLADEQIGDPGFYEELFLGYRKWILGRPNAFTLLVGDLYEQPVRNNKASDYWDIHLMPKEAVKKARELLKPLAEEGRILGGIDGNHEYRAYLATGESPMQNLLDKLGLPVEGKNSVYDPEALVVKIAFGEDKSHGKQPSYRHFIYKIYFSHGWGGARKTGGQVNKTEELAAVVTNADVYILGHEHTLFVTRWDSGFIPDSLSATECKPMRQVFVGAGTFCRYSKFQKRIQRRLPNLGAPRIRLEGISGHKSHKDCHVSI